MQSVSFKLAFIFLALGVILLPHAVSAAEIKITEIMYSPSGPDAGHEWVEVHNRSNQDIRLTDWSLRENEVDHHISAEDNQTLPAGARAVIADDPERIRGAYPKITSPVFDSTFSLNNSGEIIALINPDGKNVDTLQYDPDVGADGNGNSLQLSDGRWIEAEPTPQAANADQEAVDDSDDTNTNSNSDTDTASQVLQPRPEQPESATREDRSEQTQTISVDAGSNMHAIAGTQIHLQGIATTTSGEREDAEVFWSLGNGDRKQSADVFYTYNHPGSYVATLVYRSDEHNKTDQITVDIVSPDIHIADRKTGSDGYIKIANDLQRDVNLSGWHVRAKGDTDTLPDYTIVRANTSLMLDNKATGMSDGESVELLYPDGTVADTYKPTKPTTIQATTSMESIRGDGTVESNGLSAATNADNPSTTSQNKSDSNSNQLSQLFPTSSQAAAAQRSGGNNFWRWAILATLITLGGVAIAVAVNKFTQTKNRDLLSSTFDINEM